MIINNWYIAAESTEVGDQPLPVRMLGCDFVVFRTDTGAAACLSAICCHRGGDLSRGKRIGGCVQCPYHGWRFDRQGLCTKMPPLGDDATPPRRARVDAYPVEERYGYVWVFLGDLPEDERPELPHFLPGYDDREAWRVVRIRKDWNANWERMKENFVDTSHLYLVHSFGRHLASKMTIWPAEKTEWGVRVRQKFSAQPNKAAQTAVNQPQAKAGRAESTVELEVSLIGLMHRNSQQMTSGYDQIIWNAFTPVDACHTRNYGLHFRNFQKTAERDAAMVKTILYGLDEDQAVIEHLRPRMMPASPAAELWMATDAVERAYREQATDIGRRLGVIDVRRYDDLSRDRVLVVPSPGRRSEPGAWGYESVPLVEGTGAGASAVRTAAIRDAG